MQENVGEAREKVQELVLQFVLFSTWLWAKMLLKDFQVSEKYLFRAPTVSQIVKHWEVKFWMRSHSITSNIKSVINVF